jgi:hypothetical protein
LIAQLVHPVIGWTATSAALLVALVAKLVNLSPLLVEVSMTLPVPIAQLAMKVPPRQPLVLVTEQQIVPDALVNLLRPPLLLVIAFFPLIAKLAIAGAPLISSALNVTEHGSSIVLLSNAILARLAMKMNISPGLVRDTPILFVRLVTPMLATHVKLGTP